MVVPPIGAAKGKMRSPVKTCMASSAENRMAPASMTKPTITSAHDDGPSIRACAAMASAAQAWSRRKSAPLCASSPPFAWTPAAANATPAAPISAATPARMKGERVMWGSVAYEVGRRGQSSALRLLVKTARTSILRAWRADRMSGEGGGLPNSECGRLSARIARNGSRCGAPISFSIALSGATRSPPRPSRGFRSLEPVHAVVAERGDELIGFSHYLFQRSTWLINPQCYLQDLYVGEAERGSGVGRALIAAVVDAAKEAGAARVFWNTHETNAVARKLYDAVAVNTGFIQYRIEPLS